MMKSFTIAPGGLLVSGLLVLSSSLACWQLGKQGYPPVVCLFPILVSNALLSLCTRRPVAEAAKRENECGKQLKSDSTHLR